MASVAPLPGALVGSVHRQVSLSTPLSFAASQEIAKPEKKKRTYSRGRKDGPKKFQYWTPEEHKKFIMGYEQFGPKEVKKIALLVGTRTPTQVRTHMQKYLLRRPQWDQKLDQIQPGDTILPRAAPITSSKPKPKAQPRFHSLALDTSLDAMMIPEPSSSETRSVSPSTCSASSFGSSLEDTWEDDSDIDASCLWSTDLAHASSPFTNEMNEDVFDKDPQNMMAPLDWSEPVSMLMDELGDQLANDASEGATAYGDWRPADSPRSSRKGRGFNPTRELNAIENA